MAFLQIDKDLFKLGLNPTEILILAQSLEYQRNTGDCFMGDKAFAEMLNVSEKTISRGMKVLEDKGYITRDTKNVKKGRERHIKVNLSKINEVLATDKMTVADTNEELPTDKMSVAQGTNCLLPNGQNDFIKENNKRKYKKENKEYFSEAVEEIAEVDRTVAMTMWDKNDYIIKDNIITFKPNAANYGKTFRLVN